MTFEEESTNRESLNIVLNMPYTTTMFSNNSSKLISKLLQTLLSSSLVALLIAVVILRLHYVMLLPAVSKTLSFTNLYKKKSGGVKSVDLAVRSLELYLPNPRVRKQIIPKRTNFTYRVRRGPSSRRSAFSGNISVPDRT